MNLTSVMDAHKRDSITVEHKHLLHLCYYKACFLQAFMSHLIRHFNLHLMLIEHFWHILKQLKRQSYILINLLV
jgi:hypothetical protein